MINLTGNIEYARFIRKKRSEVKKELKKGKMTLTVLFSDKVNYGSCIDNMRLYNLIKSLPGFGKVKTEKLMKRLNISFCKRLNGLGRNQKKKFFQYFNII
jgi:hypothetical protein